MQLLVLTMIFALLALAFASRFLLSTRAWVNPLTVFNLSQGLLLSAYVLGIELEVFNLTINLQQFALLALGYLSFNVGAIAAVRVFKVKKQPWQPNISQSQNLMIRLSWWVLAAFVFSVAYKFLIIFATYGSVLENIITIRHDYVQGYLNYGWSNSIAFLSAHVLMLTLGIIEGSRWPAYQLRGPLLAITFITVISNDITIGGANWTFANMCLFALTWAVARERMHGLKVNKVIGSKAAIGLLVAFSLVTALIYVRSEGTLGTNQSIGNVVLFYAGGNIATFGGYVESQYASIPSGIRTFGGLYSIASYVDLLKLPPAANPEDYIFDIGASSNSNTSISFANYYVDFGALGLIVLSGTLGFLTSFALTRSDARLSIIRMQFLALMLYVCFMSIRGTPTEGKYFWVLLLLLPILQALTSRKDNSRRSISRRDPGGAPPELDHG